MQAALQKPGRRRRRRRRRRKRERVVFRCGRGIDFYKSSP